MLKNFYVLLTFLSSTINGFSQSPELNYLQANKEIIPLSGIEKLNILDQDFENSQLFLFGENHGSAQPHEVDILFFKYVYKKEKVRIYIAEVDPIKALMLNNYLKDGNEEWLTKVFKSWKVSGAQWANKAHWNKYRQLHNFYQSCLPEEKFSIIGIDVNQDYSLVANYLDLLLNNKPSRIASINKFISVADTVQYKNRKAVGQLARAIQTEMQTDKRFLKELKNNYESFDLFIKNAGYVGNGMTRDSIMFKTFADIIKTGKIENQKMYGFLGFFHTLQCKYEAMPFAGYLKKENPNLKILSLQMLALNCQVLLPYNEQLRKMIPAAFVNELRKKNPDFPMTEKYIPYELSNDNDMMKVDGIEDLKNSTTENTITAFKINTASSPYYKNKKLGEVSGFQSLTINNKDNMTTDAFQYVILFRNSPAALPIE